MSKIRLMALGGLNENGKNTYIVEVDKSIFIFDCGIKFASDKMYGIDYILPDYSYLVKNKNNIKGLFLSHAHPENIGGIFDLVKLIPNLKVFATKFTIEYLKLEGFNSKITEINAHQKIKFGNISVLPINVNHSVPDAVMYALNTKDGAIVYTGDFLIDPGMKKSYSMDLGKIAYVGKLGVLALLSESAFSAKTGHTSPNHRFEPFYNDIINKCENRLLISVFKDHLYTIEEIFNALKNTHKKIVIMGKPLQNLINMAIKEKYLEVDKKVFGNLSNINDKNVVILINDDKNNQYHSIRKIMDGYDKFISLRKGDSILFAEPSYDSTEKKVVDIQNELALMDIESYTIEKNKSILQHASSEDLMMMLDLLKPKYYMPIKGEYRNMVDNANIANKIGIPAENIILKQNGDIATIENGKLINKNEHININDILIDGSINEDVGELVLKDREVLSTSGIVLISASINKKTKKIILGPEITTRGFIYVKDSSEIIKEIKKISAEVINKNITKEGVQYNQIKQEVREQLSAYFYSTMGSKPMIIAVIQEV